MRLQDLINRMQELSDRERERITERKARLRDAEASGRWERYDEFVGDQDEASADELADLIQWFKTEGMIK